MKIRTFGLMVLLVFCLGICSVYAQEAPKNQPYYLSYTVVEPSTAADFEANHKKILAEYVKHGFKYPFTAYSTSEFDYYFLFKIDTFADMDDIVKSRNEIRTKVGEDKFDALWAGFGGKYQYNRNGFYIYRPDLSYLPEAPILKPEEVNFIIWLNYYIKSDKEAEAHKIMKEWVSLFKSKNVDRGFYAYQGGIGSDMPYLSVSLAGKNAMEYFAQDIKNNEIMGKEMAELWKKTFSTTRKFEVKMGMPRPDLSYIPKPEPAAAK